MVMKKATVYKNNSPVFRKNHVRLTGQVFSVQSVPKTFRKKSFTDKKFGLRILVFYTGHIIRTLFLAMDISHDDCF